MKPGEPNSNKAAFVGFLFVLPFFILNFIVALRIEPFYSLLGSIPTIRNNPFLPMLLLFLFPIGIYIALRPMLQRDTKKKNVYLLNLIVAVFMSAVFLVLVFALGEEIYRCDVLQIPNCD